jgi:hypothetical protein
VEIEVEIAATKERTGVVTMRSSISQEYKLFYDLAHLLGRMIYFNLGKFHFRPFSCKMYSSYKPFY